MTAPQTETALRTRLLNILSQHQGHQSGISAQALATKMDLPARHVRKLISSLRDEDGAAICGHPSTGYFMATTPEELHQSCEFLVQRAMHSLRLASRIRKVSLPDLLGQLKLNQA